MIPSSTLENLEQRLVDLEIRLTLQEDSVTQLSEELYLQQKHNRVLELQLAQLQLKLKSLAGQQGAVCDPSQETPPPHY